MIFKLTALFLGLGFLIVLWTIGFVIGLDFEKGLILSASSLIYVIILFILTNEVNKDEEGNPP